MNDRRTGKIARLPKELRDRVNVMMRDGEPYGAIIDLLDRLGYPGVNEQNCTNWRQGGHQEWLEQEERLADMQAKREFAFEIVKANEGSQIHEASLQLAASQIYEVLTDFDVRRVKELLDADPENYAHLVNALAKLSKGSLEIDKFRAQKQSQIDAAIDALMAEAQSVPAAVEYLNKARQAMQEALGK